MVFTDIDKSTLQTLCTLAKYAGQSHRSRNDIIRIGARLGVSREDTEAIIDEWEECDTLEFGSDLEKRQFLRTCFSHIQGAKYPNASEYELYDKLILGLGIRSRSIN